MIPAPLEAPYPGFSIDLGSDSPRFQSLHEGVDTEVQGTTASSECTAPGIDGPYRLSAIVGDALHQYGAVIDQHVPLEVGYREGTLLLLHGPDVEKAPTITDVIDATPDQWAALLGR